MSSTTRSLLEMMSNTSPRVPLDLEKPQASASVQEGESARRPMETLTSRPASAKESRMFWAWAGACEPQPMTPTCLTPAKAPASLGNLSRPPRMMYSSLPANDTSSFSKDLVLKSRCTAFMTRAAELRLRSAARETLRAGAARAAVACLAALVAVRLCMDCIVAGRCGGCARGKGGAGRGGAGLSSWGHRLRPATRVWSSRARREAENQHRGPIAAPAAHPSRLAARPGLPSPPRAGPSPALVHPRLEREAAAAPRARPGAVIRAACPSGPTRSKRTRRWARQR
jgi:hypothetical protein